MINSKFITTEPLANSGEAGEKMVWEAIQTAFADRECLGYWRYPIFDRVGKFRKEPDILIGDRQLGLIIIEVKSLTIDQIVAIIGHQWQYRNFYTASGNPYQQAENQLFALLGYTEIEPSLQRQVTGRVAIALPKITTKQWQEKNFHKLPTSPPIIFRNHLRLSASSSGFLLQQIQQITPVSPGNPLSPQQWQLLLAILGGTKLYSQPTHRVLANNKSRGKTLQKLRQHISQLDWEQERIAKQIPPGPQRIRGIAGSGKTVLLCQKAAHIHLKHPQWKIALVFFSRSLYHPILEQLDKWLRRFSNNQIKYDSNNQQLQILHAWGAKNQPGLYSLLCQATKVPRLTVQDTESKQPNEALAEICFRLLKQTTIPQIYDAILIDEGQDLIVDNWKYENKQPFYWLAYQALRPANLTQPEQKRLIWAYDEVQSLASFSIPSASELFGENLGHLVTGKYPSGINKSEILSRCYRTPQPILTAAHAISMGLLRSGGMLTGITRREDWQAIGYQVTGRFLTNQKITIERPSENSPNPMPQLWENNLIEFKTYSTRQQELSALADKIISNLRYDGLRPSREILVIILGNFFEATQLETYVAKFLLNHEIDIFIPGNSDCNLIQTDRKKRNPNQFWCEGCVTVSRIHRAKGNEADMVYIIGLDNLAKEENNLHLRNQLFIALTRARGWVNLSGIESYPFYQEMQQVIDSGDTFTFIFRRPPRREISLTDASELLKRYAAGGRNFQNADLNNANLTAANLCEANLIGAILKNVNLSYANLERAKLVIADLSYANLIHASLKKAKLMGANLQNAQLFSADLTRANLSNSDLRNTILIGVNLSGANLSYAD
ncbi:MAG: pentapeptide repeat-containing protein, partial [Oscillatoria sp. PMC 1076.18]|nr:pentapeptide repeat-containing protein [Oscillatoria sp. PMC 1076.18]